jgi:hypothetical protein
LYKFVKDKQGVCHIVALPFYIKTYIKAKEEELWKLKYFTTQKKKKHLIFKKSSLKKKNQNP